jgi:ribosomal protein S27AE
MGDIGWGCSCSRNVRADTPTSAKALVVPARNIRSVNPASTIPSRQLLADSDDPAREWWDHDRNDEANYQTVTLRASRTAQWICPECGHSFLAKVLEMTSGRHSCPACSATREAAWHEEYERWKATPVSDLPELAAAWAERPTHAQSWSREEINTASGAPPAITPEFHRSGSSSLAAPTAAPIRRGKRRRTGSPTSSPKSPPNGTRQGTASSPLIASSGIPSAKCGGWPIAATMNGKPPP